MKIEFFSEVEGLAESVPIINAKDYKMNWFDASRADYLNTLNDNKGLTFAHAYRCPGIFDLYNHGFFLPAWCDIRIETNGDPSGFKWVLPNADLLDLMEDKPIINTHSFDGVGKHIPVPPNTLRTIIKINSPWHVMAPKGVKFLINPIPYSDDFTFTNATGILDPSISSEINFQLYWHNLNGVHTIKAGTPLIHMIPITEKKYELICRDKNARDELWIKKRKFLNNFTFMLKRNYMKKSYEKHNESKCPFSRLFK